MTGGRRQSTRSRLAREYRGVEDEHAVLAAVEVVPGHELFGQPLVRLGMDEVPQCRTRGLGVHVAGAAVVTDISEVDGTEVEAEAGVGGRVRHGRMELGGGEAQ